MRVLLTFISCMIFAVASSQNYTRDFSLYKSTNLQLGYGYSFAEPNTKDFHLLEVGINKTVYGGRHGAGFQYGFGTEIGLNTENLIFGPKLSGFLYYGFLTFGVELVTYTDFNQNTLRFVPALGIGGERFKITINPHLILINKSFQPIDRGMLSFSINIPLQRKK
ncbi:hypothetical protein [Tenacibaculum agarivorans]|uniref:hypothetical protein n=1 Tax=Tenacibaculum agarivorans TaxID=1908389 RepID=UPI00094B8A55|nr:hypothetical protein [Tenacibaculum agarivorans]